VTHYEVLGVAPDAPAGEVRAAFVSLARRHHPDYFASSAAAVRADAEQRMRAINEAWTVLSDPGRRAAYDRQLGLVPEPDRFRPIEPDEPDEPDPRDEPDVPYRRASAQEVRTTRLATIIPIGLFAASIVLVVFGLLLSVGTLVALGVFAFMLSCAGFVVVPLLVLARAARDEG
jgi:hypothetical protein